MQAALKELHDHGRVEEHSALVANFAERQRLVNKPYFDELARKYADEK